MVTNFFHDWFCPWIRGIPFIQIAFYPDPGSLFVSSDQVLHCLYDIVVLTVNFTCQHLRKPFLFLFYRQKQTIQQIGALFLLIIAAVLLSIGEGSSKASASNNINPDEILFYGIAPVLVASVLSGLASALCQWASQASRSPSFFLFTLLTTLLLFIYTHLYFSMRQVKKHSSYMMTIEMSIIGSLCLIASAFKSPDGEAIRLHGFFYGWTALTMV